MSFPIITLRCENVNVDVSPSRGTIVTGVEVGGLQLLALDRESFDNPAKQVRGGIPLLFPMAGSLKDELLEATGTRMKQHGFGRTVPWEVVEHTRAMIRAALEPTPEIRAQYPYDYRLEHTVLAIPRGVHIELLVTNKGKTPLPVAPGWHPYFVCPRADKSRVHARIDGVKNHRMDDSAEFNFGLVAPTESRVEAWIPTLGEIRLEFSPEMRHVQFWAPPGTDFVCIEPFTGPPNILNTSRRIDVAPGASHLFSMRIEHHAKTDEPEE